MEARGPQTRAGTTAPISQPEQGSPAADQGTLDEVEAEAEADHVTGPPPVSAVRAQIQARMAERRDVDVSLADPVARRRAPKSARRSGRPARHRRPRRFQLLWHVFIFCLVTLVIVVGLRTFLVASFYIPSGSMEPTLHGCPGCQPDLVMVDKLSYRFASISRGEVVVFDRPPGAPADDKQLIKRVIGLPGEVVSGHDGKVWIGTRPLEEPYVNPVCNDPASGNFAAVTVAANRYFMMGDNRCESFDSRRFGTIERKAVVGRAFAVVWPFKHWRWL